MSETRRFTRSSTSAFRHSLRRDNKTKEQVELELKIKKAMVGKNFNEALCLINSVSPQDHWAACKRAQVLF